jgi:hypothetical protein
MSAISPHRPDESALVADLSEGKRELFTRARILARCKKNHSRFAVRRCESFGFSHICPIIFSARAVLKGGRLCWFEVVYLGFLGWGT